MGSRGCSRPQFAGVAKSWQAAMRGSLALVSGAAREHMLPRSPIFLCLASDWVAGTRQALNAEQLRILSFEDLHDG